MLTRRRRWGEMRRWGQFEKAPTGFDVVRRRLPNMAKNVQLNIIAGASAWS